MTATKTVLLLRHARSTANAQGILAGRLPGVTLDEKGQEQAQKVAAGLAGLPIEFIVHSELERTQATVAPLADALGVSLREDRRISECDYGTWSGRELSALSKEDLWDDIQNRPSVVRFPEGESMIEMQTRALAALEFWAEEAEHLFAVCSHGDVIKAIVAGAIGLPLDKLQTLHVSPASLTVLQLSGGKWALNTLNHSVSSETAASLTLPAKPTVGGGDVNA
jgi:probable phosphomutase (TIGR03848 family)